MSRVPAWTLVSFPREPQRLELKPASKRSPLTPTQSLSRAQDLSRARYIVVSSAPFGGTGDLHFIAHYYNRRLMIKAAYHIRTDIVATIPMWVSVIMKPRERPVANIQWIVAVPGLATGTVWTEVAKAFSAYLGVKRISIFDSTNRQCSDGTSFNYSHRLLFKHGETYYERFGFRHQHHATWRRDVKRFQRLTVGQVLDELERLRSSTTAASKEEKQTATLIAVIKRHACDISTPFASCVSQSMKCKEFANYISWLGTNKIQSDDFPALQTLYRIHQGSRGMRHIRWIGGGSDDIILVRTSDTHFVVKYEHDKDDFVCSGKYDPEKQTVEIYTVGVLSNVNNIMRLISDSYKVDKVYYDLPFAGFFDLKGTGLAHYDELETMPYLEYDTVEDARAAIASAQATLQAPKTLTDLTSRIRAWHQDASTMGRIEYQERGEIQLIRFRHPDILLEKQIESWGQFPIPFTSENLRTMQSFILVMPNVWWIRGRRYHLAAFWKAVNVVYTYMGKLVWKRPASP